jgi:3-methyladenine DNA glycosylase AlkD
MFSTDIKSLHASLMQVRVAADAPRMKSYMKDHFEFIGVKSKARKEVSRPYLKSWLSSKKLEKELVKELWTQDEREFQYIAMDYLDRTKRYWVAEDLGFFQMLVQTKSWWDSVDMIASHFVGGVVKKYPGLKPIISDWNQSEDMWLVRTSIIYQLGYKEDTDMDEMKRFILAHADSKEFFLRKASGWALRQAARFFPEIVKDFVESNELSNLTRREAMKHLS